MWERDNVPLQIAAYEKKIIAILEIILSCTQEVSLGNSKTEVSTQIESKTSKLFRTLAEETRLQCWQPQSSSNSKYV